MTQEITNTNSFNLDKDFLEIQETFKEAKDFRSIWEKITAPFDEIVSQSAKIIENDPIMKVNDELLKVNTEVQWVYNEILNKDNSITQTLKNIPLIWWLVQKIQDKKFDIKSTENKIQTIFSWFDISYNSLNTSIDLQRNFIDWINQNISKVENYKNFIDEKIISFKAQIESETDLEKKEQLSLFLKNVEFFNWNLVVLIWNLKLTEKRLLIRLDSAWKLSLSMNASRPIFKTLLSTALIETSSQKALDSSLKAMEMMWSTIDKMSSELTQKTIDTALKSEQASTKPVLSNTVFVENVTKLKNHFDEIENYRKDLLLKNQEEQNAFIEAKNSLDNLKILSKNSQIQLENELTK